jgi:hypothetical protein
MHRQSRGGFSPFFVLAEAPSCRRGSKRVQSRTDKLVLAALGLALVAGLAVWAWRRQPGLAPVPPPVGHPDPAATNVVAGGWVAGGLGEQLAAAAADLASARGKGFGQEQLARLRQALENYLLDPRRSAAELAQFAGTFPNV